MLWTLFKIDLDWIYNALNGEAPFYINHKNGNFLDCDCFKKLLFSTNSLAKLLSDSLLLDSLLSDSSV